MTKIKEVLIKAVAVLILATVIFFVGYTARNPHSTSEAFHKLSQRHIVFTDEEGTVVISASSLSQEDIVLISAMTVNVPIRVTMFKP